MANTTLSPNMGMPIPTVSVDPGPDWAQNINASLSIVDSHNHSPGQGELINPNGLDINIDLPFNGNNATTLRSTRFTPQVSPLSGSGTPDIGCLYESGVDLYYNDGNGNTIRLTSSGSIVGTAGSISGLPSGTASASYSSPTFSFQSATSTPAYMASGPLVLGYPAPGSATITISPTNGQPSNYALNLPSAAPGNHQILVSDASGNLTWIGSYVPASSFVASFGNTVGPVTNTWQYSMVGNVVTVTIVPNSATFTMSASGSVNITGVPSVILPTTTINCSPVIVAFNGGAFGMASMQATTSGFSFQRDLAQDGFGSGTTSILQGCTFSYVLR